MTQYKPTPHYSVKDAARRVEQAACEPDSLDAEVADLRQQIADLTVLNEMLRSENERLARDIE